MTYKDPADIVCRQVVANMARSTPVKKGCGTCRDRKILCDRSTPTCSQCLRTKRACKGYGLQLSWPREGDRKRAMVLKPFQSISKTRNRRITDASMVHATEWDIEMYMYLSLCSSSAPLLHTPVVWNPHQLGEKDWDLMSYFRHTASRSLTTFGHDAELLGDMLVRISQSDTTLASTAVLHSLLGLASTYRYGYNAQSMQFKISSLRALAEASISYNEAKEGVHHIAAGMLLCSIEVHQASCSASEWAWYVNGIKELLYSDRKELKCTSNEEKNALLLWLYYHDVMKHFSIRHWKPEKTAYPLQSHDSAKRRELIAGTHLPLNPLCYNPLPGSPWTTWILKLMSDICFAVARKPSLETMKLKELDEYAKAITILDWRIRNITLPSLSDSGSYTSTMPHLYKLAMLIYLNRVTNDVLNQASMIQEYIDNAFDLLSTLSTCKPHFPLYIIGWEARTEERRTAWLEVLERTKKDPASRAVFHVEALVQAGWTQDDLADKELNYWDKVTTLVSSCSTMPSFV